MCEQDIPLAQGLSVVFEGQKGMVAEEVIVVLKKDENGK